MLHIDSDHWWSVLSAVTDDWQQLSKISSQGLSHKVILLTGDVLAWTWDNLNAKHITWDLRAIASVCRGCKILGSVVWFCQQERDTSSNLYQAIHPSLKNIPGVCGGGVFLFLHILQCLREGSVLLQALPVCRLVQAYLMFQYSNTICIIPLIIIYYRSCILIGWVLLRDLHAC